MDQDGQLTFADDPLLSPSNDAYQLLSEGNFNEAVKKFDQLLNINPDYPGLVEGYRTARFWLNRKDELQHLAEGKATADFLMKQWEDFSHYAAEKEIFRSNAYTSIRHYIFFAASEHYKIAFQRQESPTDNFDLLLNLGVCFLTLKEYSRTVETLEYARSSYQSNAKLLSLLGEAYYQLDEKPKSLLLFREAFFINPDEIDLDMIQCEPITSLAQLIQKEQPNCKDLREWIPVYGYIAGLFFVRRHLNKQEVEVIKKDIYSLEINYQGMDAQRLQASNIVPRLINKYLWLFDYFEFQEYDHQNLGEIRSRLIQIDRQLFEGYFKNRGKI